jgi:hypothetical protein
MHLAPTDAHGPEGLGPGLHRAARVEDAVYGFIEPRLRQRGWRDAIVPYTGYGGPSWVRVMARLLLRPQGPQSERVRAVRGWRSFGTLPVAAEVVTIDVGDQQHEVRTDRGGNIDVIVEADLEPGWRSVRLHRAGAEPVEAPVRVLAPDVRFAVVSDIDDTIMVTALPRPLLAAWNTFVLDEYARSPVPGMAVLYERLVTAHPKRRSSTVDRSVERRAGADPLPVAQPLPPRAAAAHRLGPDDRSLFRSGQAHKRATLERLRRSSRTSAGCSSATTGSTTRRSTATSSRRIRTTSPRWPSGSCLRRSRCSPVACRSPPTVPHRRLGTERPWMSAPDGAGLAHQLSETGLL